MPSLEWEESRSLTLNVRTLHLNWRGKKFQRKGGYVNYSSLEAAAEVDFLK